MERRDFNVEAATWDENPGRIKAASDIAETVLREISLSPEMEVLDFGCGTGLVTLRLSPFVRSVTGVDSSTGMLDILKAKIEECGIQNVQARYLNPEQWDLPNDRYDLAVVVMTLHHVPEIAPLLDRLAAVLVPGGLLCIADLDLDDGQFHSDNTGVFHFGFDRDKLSSAFIQAGLDDVRVCTAAQIGKPTKTGVLRTFTVFLMIGTKSKQ